MGVVGGRGSGLEWERWVWEDSSLVSGDLLY